ncbi:hypothetical protein HYW32_01765 [Candidatus Berkelbacteria bacterium]|nr:hypothetical protein [Candidatus Berkelbacteria bacterium]
MVKLASQKFAKPKMVKISLDRVRKFYAASAVMLDLAEEILEEHGEYTKEFLAR